MDRTDQADSATFAPVQPRLRHDGWTPPRQRAFVEALAETGCVAAAARSVGLTAQTAYRLRKRADAADFAAAWDTALEIGRAHLLDVAFDRAVNGVATPIFYKGEQVGERRAYNDKLLMLLLRSCPGPSTPRSQRDFVGADWDAAMDRLEYGEPMLPEPGSPGWRAMAMAAAYREPFRPDREGAELAEWFTARHPPRTSYDDIDHEDGDEWEDEDLDDPDAAETEDDQDESKDCEAGEAAALLSEAPAHAADDDHLAPPEPAATAPEPAPDAAPQPAADPPPPVPAWDDPTSGIRRVTVPPPPRWRPDVPPSYAQPL